MEVTGLHDIEAGGFRLRNLRDGSVSSDAVTLSQLQEQTKYRWFTKTIYDPVITKYPLWYADKDLKIRTVIAAVKYTNSFQAVNFRLQKTTNLNSGHVNLQSLDTVLTSASFATYTYYKLLAEGEGLGINITFVTPYIELFNIAIEYTYDVAPSGKVLFFYGKELFVATLPNPYKLGGAVLSYGVDLTVDGMKPYNAVEMAYDVQLGVSAGRTRQGALDITYGLALGVLAEKAKNGAELTYGADLFVKGEPLAKIKFMPKGWLEVRAEPVKSGRADITYGADLFVSATKEGYVKVEADYGVDLTVTGNADKSANVSILAKAQLESPRGTVS